MDTQSSTGRTIDQAAFLNILNSRATLKTTDVNKQVMLAVQGNGQFLAKGHKYEVAGTPRENQFDRTIYNLRANSQLSMLRKENKAILTEALKLESAGKTEEASAKFNEYLNAVQVSFSVIEPSNRKFASGDMVTAIVAISKSEATQQDQIVVNDVRYKAPETVAKTKFDLTSLIEQDEEAAEVFTADSKVTA